MSDAPFRPLETHLDRDGALGVLRSALDGAEDGELFFERKRSEGIVFDDGRVKQANYDASEGFGLRAVKGEVAGYAHSTEISEAALTRAAETARLAVGDGGGVMSPAPSPTNQRLYTDADPIAGLSFPAKLETLREIDAFLRDLDPRVVQVSASLAASLQEVSILRADGHMVSDTRPMTRLNISVIVEENGRRESGTAGGGGRVLLDGLVARADWEAKARGSCARGRDGHRPRPRLARHPVARGGGSRARGRFQPQGHLGFRGAHGPAGGGARGDRAR